MTFTPFRMKMKRLKAPRSSRHQEAFINTALDESSNMLLGPKINSFWNEPSLGKSRTSRSLCSNFCSHTHTRASAPTAIITESFRNTAQPSRNVQLTLTYGSPTLNFNKKTFCRRLENVLSGLMSGGNILQKGSSDVPTVTNVRRTFHELKHATVIFTYSENFSWRQPNEPVTKT